MDNDGTINCFIPDCKNTSKNKRFCKVPSQISQRQVWLQKCLKSRSKLSCIDNDTTLFCCEDHFDLKKDAIEEWLDGDHSDDYLIELKDHVVPHKLLHKKNVNKTNKSKRKKTKENLMEDNNCADYEMEIIESINDLDNDKNISSTDNKALDSLLEDVGLKEKTLKRNLCSSHNTDTSDKNPIGGKKKKRKVIKEILAWIPAPNNSNAPPPEVKAADGKILLVGSNQSTTISAATPTTPTVVVPSLPVAGVSPPGSSVPNVATLPLKKDKITQFIISVPEAQGGAGPKLPLLAIPEGYTYTIDKMTASTQIITELDDEIIITLDNPTERLSNKSVVSSELPRPTPTSTVKTQKTYLKPSHKTPEPVKEKVKDINLGSTLKFILNEFRAMKKNCDTLNKQVNKLRVENGKLRNQIAARIKENTNNVKVVQKEVKVVQREIVEQEPDKSKKMEYAAEELKKIFTPNQVRVLFDDKARVQWTNEEITNAYSIYNVSSQAYKILHDDLKYPFPSITTLKRYHEKVEIHDRLSTADQFDSEEEVQRDENAIRMALGQPVQHMHQQKKYSNYEQLKPTPKVIAMKNIQNTPQKSIPAPQKKIDRPKFDRPAPAMLNYPRNSYIPNYQPYTDTTKQCANPIVREPLNMGIQPIQQTNIQPVQTHDNIMYEEVIIHCDNNDIYQTYRPNSYL